MRILIIGFTGFLGPSIARHVSQESKVFGMGRSPKPNSVADATYVVGDRSNPHQVREIIQDQKIDVVIDIIPMIADDTLPILACLDSEINQYVMISSSDVYANYELLHRRSTGKAIPDAVTEDSPLRSSAYPYREEQPRPDSHPDKYLDYYDKIPIEKAVQRLSSAWTILRFGDRQRRFRWAISPMLKKQGKLVIPRTWANWQSTYGYIENVGAAIAATVGNENAYNQIFNVAERKQVSQLEWARRIAKITGWQGVIELTDDPDDPFHKRTSGLDLNVPFKVDGSKLRNTLKFSDVVSETLALKQTAASEASI